MNRYPIIACISVALLQFSLATHGALVGWWDFEEGTGLTTADKSGGGHTGTLGTGASWSTTEFAPVPSGSTASIEFDGSDLAHVIMNGYKADEVGGTNSRTLAAWIKSAPGVTPAASNLGIFGYGENQAGDKFNFRTQQNNGPIDGNIRVEVNGGYIIGSTVVIDGQWHHVAMTWEDDGTPNVLDVLLYVDGVLETISASLDEPIHTDTAAGIDLAISDDHSNREWNGWLDDIRIYDEVLTPEEILALATGAPVIESFSADAEAVAPGAPLTLSWEVDPTFDTLVIDNGVGDVAPNTVAGVGSIEVMPTVTTTYTLTGTLGGDTQDREITVLVGEAPIIDEFAFTGSGVVLMGNSADLIWNTFGETSLSIAPEPGDVTGTSEATVTPVADTVYTLSATNPFGTTTAEVTLTIRQGGLVAHYNFTTEPSPTLIDESPGGTNNVDVTFGATSPTWLAEDNGRTGVLSFDDTAGGQVRLLSPPTVPLPNGGFTVMLWAKSDQPAQTQYGTLFANGQGATNHFQIDSDGAGNWRIRDSSSVNTPFGPIVDEWTHLAVTWDGTSRIMYYNGVPVGAPSPSNPGSAFDEYRIGLNRANDANGPVDAEIDDIRVYDFALDAAGVLAAMNDSSGGPALKLDIENSGADLVFTWESKLGKLYTLHSEVDPSAADPIDWPVFDGHADLAATPPQNTLTIPRPDDPSRFFAVEEFDAPPVAIFTDDFEAGQGAWTTAVIAGDGSTAWMHGTPAAGVGPGAANSGTMAFGTNLSGPYTPDHTVILVSPVIDLTGAGDATLRYSEFKDIELMFDAGTVTALDAADDSVIAEIASGIEGTSVSWTEVTRAIPAAALDKMIKIEFRLTTDDFDAAAFAGWYLDDVEVTIP